jgi:lipopolysaccharide/colanic/teichoic acid biosynthesis glycosyltransferase
MVVSSKSERVHPRHLWWERFQAGKRLLRGEAYHFTKKIMDLGIIFLTVPLWVPVMAICALLVKLEDLKSPAVYVQERTGKGGRRFRMYKFRTMVRDADRLKEQLSHLNELQWPDFKISSDPRITPQGKFLRKTSLDELPQIFNVLKGEMSLVGPRPTSFGPNTYALWQTKRLDVLPGITGLWQIEGRAKTEFDERLRLDIAYIERRCLRLDFTILLRTAWSVVQQEGA